LRQPLQNVQIFINNGCTNETLFAHKRKSLQEGELMGQIRVDETLELLRGKLLSPMRKEVQRHYFRYNSCFQNTPKAKSQELYTPSPFIKDPWEDTHFKLELPRTTKGLASFFMDMDKLVLRNVASLHDLLSNDRASKLENIVLSSMLHEIMKDTHKPWDKNPFPYKHAYNGVVHEIIHISPNEVVYAQCPLTYFKLLPFLKGIMLKGNVTTFENFRKHKRIRGHLQPSNGRYCEKLAKTREKQKWQLHTFLCSPKAHPISFALFQDSHRLIFDPGGQILTKQEAAIRDQECKSEDRSSQEGGDDGHHPATTIPLAKAMDLRTNPFSRGRG